MLDIIIKNGRVVSPDSVVTMDIGIKDGTIAILGKAEDMPEAARVIDAAGKYVMPGGIDSHCHMELPFDATSNTKDDFFDGGRAEAIGGTTTLIDFITQDKERPLMTDVEIRFEEAEKCPIDYAFHCIITKADADTISKMKGLVDRGISSFKCYMLYKEDGCMAEAGDMLAAMREARECGALFGAHAESYELSDYNIRKAVEEGHTEPWWHAITKDSIVEAEGINRAMFLADVAGSAYYNFHMTVKEGYEMMKKARQEGKPFYAETITHYLVLTDEKLREPHGERFICSPPLRPQEHIDAIWKGLADGTVSTIGSDECSYDTAQKNSSGGSFNTVANGLCGCEFRMPVVFSEGVNKGRISLSRYVEVTSTNAAKIFGLYPQKGIIAIGSDADIVIMDPDKEKTVTMEDTQIDIDFNPYEGLTVKGWPVMTIARGKVIVEDGKFVGERGAGRFLPMALNPDVLKAPIV